MRCTTPRANGSGWPVEGHEEAVARRVDLASPIADQQRSDHFVVALELILPGSVSRPVTDASDPTQLPSQDLSVPGTFIDSG